MNPWSHVTVLFTSTIQPLVFLRLLTWGMSCPLCIRLTLRSGDAVSPAAKAGKTTGASVKLFKEISPPVNGCHPCPLPQERFAFCRVSIAGQIALALVRATN